MALNRLRNPSDRGAREFSETLSGLRARLKAAPDVDGRSTACHFAKVDAFDGRYAGVSTSRTDAIAPASKPRPDSFVFRPCRKLCDNSMSRRLQEQQQRPGLRHHRRTKAAYVTFPPSSPPAPASRPFLSVPVSSPVPLSRFFLTFLADIAATSSPFTHRHIDRAASLFTAVSARSYSHLPAF